MNKIILYTIALLLHCLTAYSQQIIQPKWTTAQCLTGGIDVSHDGTRFITDDDYTVSVIDAKTGIVTSTHDIFLGSSVRYVALSKSNDKIAVIDGSLNIWILSTRNNELQTLCTDDRSRGQVLTATFNNDESKLLVVKENYTADVWDTENGEKIFRFGNSNEKVISVSKKNNYQFENKNGEKIVTCDTSGAIKLWDVNNGKVLYTLASRYRYANSATFSSDGKKFTVTGPRFVMVFETETGTEIYNNTEFNFSSAIFDGASNRVFFYGYNNVLVYDFDERKVVNSFFYTSESIRWIEPNQKGDKIALITINDYEGGYITVRDVKSGKGLFKLVLNSRLIRFLGETDSLIIVDEKRSADVWNIQTKKKVGSAGFWGQLGKVTFDRRNNYIVGEGFGKGLGVIDIENGKALWTSSLRTINPPSASITSNNMLALLPQYSYAEVYSLEGDSITRTKRYNFNPIAIASFNHKNTYVIFYEDDSLRIWDTDGNLVRSNKYKKTSIATILFSPDDQTFLLVENSGTIRVYETDKWEIVRTLEYSSGGVGKYFFSENGKYIVSVTPPEIRVWSSDNGKLILLEKGVSAAVNPQENRLAIANYDSVSIWDLDNIVHINTLKGHVWDVTCVNYDHTGNRLVSGSYDNDVKLWNANSGHLIAILSGNTSFLRGVLFDANNKFILSVNNQGVFKLYDVGGIVSEVKQEIGKLMETSFEIETYPNDDKMSITLLKPSLTDQLFTIHDITGSLVASGTIPKGLSQIVYNIGNLPKGLFFVSFVNSCIAGQKKFLKTGL